MKAVASAFSILALSFGLAHAESCESIVKHSVFSSKSSYSKDWRLYRFITEEEFSKRTVGGSLDIEIPGYFDGGADYNNVQEFSRLMEETHDERLTEHQAQNIFWTGLDDNTRVAYVECLQRSSAGLLLAPRLATRDSVELVLRYNPVDTASEPLQLKWGGNVVGVDVPATINPGSEISIIVPRPKDGSERLISVAAGTVSRSLIVTALPEPAKPPQAFRHLKVSLRGGGEDLGNGVMLKEIFYRHVGSQQTPHVHEFEFILAVPGNDERKKFVVDQSLPWQNQIRRYPTSAGLLEMTFHSYNDGAGQLAYRFW